MQINFLSMLIVPFPFTFSTLCNCSIVFTVFSVHAFTKTARLYYLNDSFYLFCVIFYFTYNHPYNTHCKNTLHVVKWTFLFQVGGFWLEQATMCSRAMRDLLKTLVGTGNCCQPKVIQSHGDTSVWSSAAVQYAERLCIHPKPSNVLWQKMNFLFPYEGKRKRESGRGGRVTTLAWGKWDVETFPG